MNTYDFTKPTLFPSTLSTTRDIEVFNSCNYKWFVSRCQRYSKYAYNNDLEAGSEFAKAVELTRTAFYKQGLSEEEAVELGAKLIIEEFGEKYFNQNKPKEVKEEKSVDDLLDSYCDAPTTVEVKEVTPFQDELKTPAKLEEVFRRMFKEHPMEAESITPFEMEDGTLSVEQNFSVTLPFNNPDTGEPLVLKCLLDMLGMKNGVIYVVDEKTCKSVLTDAIKQADLLRTQNQFVQYVTVANMNKDKFGASEDLSVTHVRINRCKIKKTYAKNEEVVVPYDFIVDVWFQKTWWNNLLYIIEDMIIKYREFKEAIDNPFYNNNVIFPRAYGSACTLFFSPCKFTYHCTSGNAQNLEEQGFKQVVCDSSTGYKEIPLITYLKDKQNELHRTW